MMEFLSWLAIQVISIALGALKAFVLSGSVVAGAGLVVKRMLK